MKLEDALWVEKYRPHRVADCVLPAELRKTFQAYADSGEMPNLLLHGGPGVGKTTVAKAVIDEIGADSIMINGSMSGNIDTLRNDVRTFASAVSFTGDGRKFVILDEADYLNPNSFQPALRGFIEEYAGNCGFVLTANFPNRIIPPLRSRLVNVQFSIQKEDRPALAAAFMKRLQTILNAEGVEFVAEAVVAMITRHFPDWRRILNELQSYAIAHGRIDTGILAGAKTENLRVLIDALKSKSFTEVRKWVADNINSDSPRMMRDIYDAAYEYVRPASIPPLVVLINDYQYKAAFVADQEINMVAFLTEMMVGTEWK